MHGSFSINKLVGFPAGGLKTALERCLHEMPEKVRSLTLWVWMSLLIGRLLKLGLLTTTHKNVDGERDIVWHFWDILVFTLPAKYWNSYDSAIPCSYISSFPHMYTIL